MQAASRPLYIESSNMALPKKSFYIRQIFLPHEAYMPYTRRLTRRDGSSRTSIVKNLYWSPIAMEGGRLDLRLIFAIYLPAAAADMPFCSSFSILATDRDIRPPYSLSPSVSFTLAAVNPVDMSPGIIAHTLIPYGRTSLRSAPAYEFSAAFVTE